MVTTAVSAQDKVYNGTTSDIIDDSTGNPITPVLSTLLFPTDKVTLVQGSVDFADPNVGTGKPVTFSGFSITGADAADYALTPPTSSTTATITAATLVITATARRPRPTASAARAAAPRSAPPASPLKVEIPGPSTPPTPPKILTSRCTAAIRSPR